MSKIKYVYEFTNKRKVTKSEYIRWFQKKFFYTIRKFSMIEKGDVVGYYKANTFRAVVLEDLFEMFVEKAPIEVVKTKDIRKVNKFALPDTSDAITSLMINRLIKYKASDLKNLGPVEGKIIKPLYLFLDKEVLLYAKLKSLKFVKPKTIKKDRISQFIEELEVKHPELKHSVVNTYLELFKKD